MISVSNILALLVGCILGFGVAFLLKLLQARTAKAASEQTMSELIKTLRANFGELSLKALSRSSEEFLKLAKSRLEVEREVSTKEFDSKKALIDQQLKRMAAELENVSKLTKDLEKDRVEKFGELSQQLKKAGEQTNSLIQTTNLLREALASTKVRGQWGERMAEDVLRLAGFIENINYSKQEVHAETLCRPDFTFYLPRERKLNMDVKFPLDNYLKFLEASSDLEREKFRKDFMRDIRLKIKEVTTRDYINPEEDTVDYVILFIPNEQIYAFIHEQDRSILDDGLKNKVIFCSPITLFAVLAIIRQAVDNFALEKASNQILSCLGSFKKQWDKFTEKLDLMGKRISDVQSEYESLITTRRRQLERPLNQIEAIRTERGLPIDAQFAAEEVVPIAQLTPSLDETASEPPSLDGRGRRGG